MPQQLRHARGGGLPGWGSSPSTPFFLYFALHNTHEPLECPDAQLHKFDFIYDNCTAAGGMLPGSSAAKDCDTVVAAENAIEGSSGASGLVKTCCFRQYYAAMANYADQHIGEVVTALKDMGMYNNTLIVMTSDNGGPIYRNGAAGGNNWPLRGGKKSNFDGGVRVNAFVSGGFLPASQRGTVSTDWMAIEVCVCVRVRARVCVERWRAASSCGAHAHVVQLLRCA